MTTEQDFQAKLDEVPESATVRGAFADWLEEHDDPRAEGYRAMAVLGQFSHHSGPDLRTDIGGNRCPYWFGTEHWTPSGRDPQDIPMDWFDLIEMPGKRVRCAPHWTERKDATRRECDDAGALAFAKLPPERKAELLQLEPSRT